MDRILRKLGAAVFLVCVILPGFAWSRGMDLYIDPAISSHGVIRQGIGSFLKGNPQAGITMATYAVPSGIISRIKPDGNVHVLITTGKGDWDAIKEMLKERGAIKLQVIGIGIADQDQMIRLSGVASISGGEYYVAWDAKSLKDALSDIERRGNYNLEVKAFKRQNEELTDYMMWRYKPLWISEVYEAGKREKAVTSAHIFPARFNLPSGLYDIKVRFGHSVRWIEGVRVEKGRLLQKAVNFAKGMLLVKVLNDGHPIIGVRKKALKNCWYSEAYEAGKRDNPVEVAYTFPPEFDLVSGRYDIKVHYKGNEQWLENVMIEEDKTTVLGVRFPHNDRCSE